MAQIDKKILIKKEIERYCDQNKYKKHKKSIFTLLNKFENKNPTLITSSKKHNLFAAAIIKFYFNNKKIVFDNKSLASFFGLKTASIREKASVLSWKMKSRQEIIQSFKEQGINIGPTVEDFVTIAHDFVDEPHYEISDKYYNLLEILDGMDTKEQISELQKLIEEAPYFLDPYIIIAEIYEYKNDEYSRMRYLETAYENAISLIKTKKYYPKELIWGFVENRHIIRAMFNYAMFLWENKDKDNALKIFVYLLKSNPNDNIGARYSILGILNGFTTQAKMEEKFGTKEGYLDAIKMEKWFQKNSKKYRKYFKEYFDSTD